MNAQHAAELRAQVERQTKELADYNAAIAVAQSEIDTATAAIQPNIDKAAELEAALKIERDAIEAGQPAINGAQSKLSGLQSNAANIAANIATCEALLKQPIDDDEPVPLFAVSRKQIKVALNDAGLLDQFEATVSDPQDSDGKRAWISWQEDESFTKDSPVMVIVLGRMKLTNTDIDALFAAAAKL